MIFIQGVSGPRNGPFLRVGVFMGFWGVSRARRRRGLRRIVFEMIFGCGAAMWICLRDAAVAIADFCHARSLDIEDGFAPRWRRLALALLWPFLLVFLTAWALRALRFWGG